MSKDLPTAPASLSLADRFDAVLDWGRRIASALSPPVILGEARIAALRLLRAEHCMVLQIVEQEGEPKFDSSGGSIPGDCNEAKMQQALQVRRAVAFIEELGQRGQRIGYCRRAIGAVCSAVRARSGRRLLVCNPRTRPRTVRRRRRTSGRLHRHHRRRGARKRGGLRTTANIERKPGTPRCRTHRRRGSPIARTGAIESRIGTLDARVATGSARIDRRQAGRRSSQSGQESVPGRDEPRNSHPDERRHWHDRIGPEHAAFAPATKLSDRRQRFRHCAACRSSTTFSIFRKSKPGDWSWNRFPCRCAMSSKMPRD